MDTTLPSWLVYCRPGFERDCVEETQAKPVEAVENSGYLVLQGKPKLAYRQLAFARQLLSLHGDVNDLTERDRLTPLLDMHGGRLADGLGQVIALRQAGDVQGAAAALEQLSPAFDKVAAQLEQAATLELQEVSKLQSSADKADDAASWLLIASIVWGAALGIGVTALVARSMFGKRVSKTPSTI